MLITVTILYHTLFAYAIVGYLSYFGWMHRWSGTEPEEGNSNYNNILESIAGILGAIFLAVSKFL